MRDRGAEFAKKLELLLAMFPRSDGRTWRGADIEAETNGVVSKSYFSQLRSGRWERPGLEQLSAIADVMGFPFELWRADSEQWPKILNRLNSGEWYMGTSADVAAKFTTLSNAVMNPDGQPYSDQEIAANSRGRLSAEEVSDIRRGTAAQISYDHLLALSEIFEVDFEYWKKPRTDAGFILDDEMLEALEDRDNQLLMHRTRNLSKAHKDMLLILAERMQEAQQIENDPDER